MSHGGYLTAPPRSAGLVMIQAVTAGLGRFRSRAGTTAFPRKPREVTALAALTGISPAGASRHLLALRDAGLVCPARHGHEIRYRRTELGSALLHSRRV